MTVQDVQTGSTWQMLDGIAIDGALLGETLSPVFSTTAFEFGWDGYFPESDMLRE